MIWSSSYHTKNDSYYYIFYIKGSVKMLYKEWLSNWLGNYVQPSAKQRTYTRYKEIVEQHIIPKLGDLELSEITPYVLQCYVTELL